MSTWHVIECTRGRETACAALLDRFGYPDGWWPTKRIDTRSAAEKKRNRRVPRYREIALVPGYIFIPHAQVAYHVINEHRGQLWLRVFAIGSKPVKLTDKQMSEMTQIPTRIKALMDDLERERREAMLARMPVEGGKARIISGPFEGFMGKVCAVKADSVNLDLESSILGNVTVPLEFAERVA